MNDLWGEPRDQQAADWREALFDVVRPHRDLPNLLSGGVDSGTLLAAALALDGKPPVYSFRIGTRNNPDFSTARRMATDLDLDFTIVELPDDFNRLVEDVNTLIDITQRSRKTIIQCTHPIMYMAQRIAADGHDHAVVGTGAVCLDDRKVSVTLAEHGEEAAREYRRLKLNDRYEDCGTGWMHRIAAHFGVTLEEPYSDEPLRSHALALDFKDLNRPVQKGIAVRAFPNFWRRNNYYRRNAPLQVGSGLRDWHDQLVHSHLNVNNWKTVVGVYNHMARSQGVRT